jgi:hypothetical protein
LEDKDLEETQETDEESFNTSEFVEDNPLEDTGTSKSIFAVTNQSTSEDRNQRNMEFLKQSWANMADQEESELQLIEDHVSEPGMPLSTPFSLVQKKPKSKSQIQKSISSRMSYGTSSKAGNSKPFK